MKCTECTNQATTQMAPNWPICEHCKRENWITDPVEIATEIALDPQLRQILIEPKS